MAERNQLRASEAQEAVETYIRDVAAPSAHSPSEEIAKAKSLLEAGTITAEEYSALKKTALRETHPA